MMRSGVSRGAPVRLAVGVPDELTGLLPTERTDRSEPGVRRAALVTWAMGLPGESYTHDALGQLRRTHGCGW